MNLINRNNVFNSSKLNKLQINQIEDKKMEDIVNSCVMCLQKKNADFLDIFENTTSGRVLNKYGKMYEDLVNIKIPIENVFPNFICSSCSLQLQLSINLKKKALESFAKIRDDNIKFIKSIKMEENYGDHSIVLNESNDYISIGNHSDSSNEDDKIIELNFNELSNKDANNGDLDDANDSNRSFDSDQPIYCDDVEFNESSEFLDVQYLRDADDEDIENKILDYNSSTKFEFTKNNTPNESDNDDSPSHSNDKHSFVEICVVKESVTTANKLLWINPKDSAHGRRVQSAQKRTKYQCDLCQKVSYSKEAYEVHKKVHAGLPAFKCEICEKNFKQKVHYNIHMMNHTNERNFKCEECSKKFKTKSDLRIHYELHTGERRYPCDICNKAYRAHSHMKNHRYTHFEKQLECQICKQKYTSPATLKTHIKTIHELVNPPYECIVCNKKFKRKHHLQVHMKTHNKQKEFQTIHEEPPLTDVLELTNYVQEIEEVVEEIES